MCSWTWHSHHHQRALSLLRKGFLLNGDVRLSTWRIKDAEESIGAATYIGVLAIYHLQSPRRPPTHAEAGTSSQRQPPLYHKQ